MTASTTTSSPPAEPGPRPGRSRPGYGFLLSPRWLLLHVVVALIVFAMISAAFWQLRRLDERRTYNRLLDAREALAALDVNTDLDAAATPVEVGDLEWREAEAHGTYLPEDEVLVRSRSLQGAPGAWVLTPLLIDDGTALVVNRGWIPASGPPTLPAGAEAPTGVVTVRGLLVQGDTRGSFGPVDASGTRLATLARADLNRLQEQVDQDLFPLYLRLQQQAPTITPPPYPLPEPTRDEGPHLSYAGQWFLFTAIALIGYPLLIKRSARARQLAKTRPGNAVGPPPSAADGPEPVR